MSESRSKICLVTIELAPFTPGGIGVLAANLAHHYAEHSDFSVLIAGDARVEKDVFSALFPRAQLINLSDVTLVNTDLTPPDHAYTTASWHRLSANICNALKALSADGTIFDIIEFADWGGLAFCTLQEKLLGHFQSSQIYVRLHSSEVMLRGVQPVRGSESYSNLLDLERKCLRDADKVIGHIASVAEATRCRLGFDHSWLENVLILPPPVIVGKTGETIRVALETLTLPPTLIQFH
jgi:hypothetical protein